jgi:hypothetical protein
MTGSQPSMLSDADISAPAPDAEANQRRSTAMLGPIMAFADLLVAAGLIATSNRTIELTARHIKRAALVRHPTNPQGVIDQLVGVTEMAALGCIVMLFSAPPSGVLPTTSWGFTLPGLDSLASPLHSLQQQLALR